MGIYQELFNIIHQYIYGGVELTAHMDLICVLCATMGSIFIISIPFIVVYLVIKFITGAWR